MHKNGNGITISLLPFLFHNIAKLPFSPLPPPPFPHSRMDRKKGILQMTSSYYPGTGRIGHKLIRKRFKKLQLDNIC